MPRMTADAVVVGAGVIGCSIALELSRAHRRVAVVDRLQAPGLGSTSASSAIVRFHYSTQPGVALAWESGACWLDWAGHLGGVDPAGMARFIRCGVVVIDSPGFDTDRVLALFDHIGIPYERHDAEGLRAVFPWLDSGRHHPPKALDDDRFWEDPAGQVGGFHTPDAGFVDDPSLAAANLFRAAEGRGVLPLLGRQVVAVRTSGGSVVGVTLDDGSAVDCPVVVNAAGPHSGRVNALVGVQDELRVRTRPLRQEVHQLPGPDTFHLDRAGAVVTDGDLGIYFRPEPGGEVLVGGMEPDCDPPEWLDDPDHHRVHPTVAVYEAQATRLARRVPGVTVPSRPRGIAGVYDVTDDWLPIYDRTSVAGYYLAIGTSGNQFKNAPVVGQVLRTIIEATEEGRDHDTDPVRWIAPQTGQTVDLGHYSRMRQLNPDSSSSVLG